MSEAVDAARVIATLLVTPDEHLEAFRDEFFGGAAMPVVRLRAARDLAMVVATMLRIDTPDAQARLEAGLAALRPVAPPVATPPAPAAVPAAPLRAAPPLAEHDPGSTLASHGAPSPVVAYAPQAMDVASPTSTAPTGQLSPLAGADLPFLSPVSSVVPAAMAEPVIEEMPHEHAGATASVGQMSPLADMAPLFAKRPPPAPVELTVEHYASMCAMLQVHPDQYEPTLERYGVADEDAHRALDEHWAARLDLDPALKEQFDALLIRYVEWVRTGGQA